MKFIWLSFLRAYLNVGMFFYFRKIKVYNVKNIPKNKPVLLISNHQNALLDALLIATKSDRFAYFLTRAAVFKKPVIARILKSLQLIPVYRIRDGWGKITNNNAVFKECSKLLSHNACVVIFPEGNHNLKRTVRPLSKGFTRIVFDTLEKYPNLDLQLLPVGVNYLQPENFPDCTSVYFGPPLSASQFISEYKNEAILRLKAKIYTEIAKLTTNIPKDNYEETLMRLQESNVDFLDPVAVNTCVESNFKTCKTQRLKKQNSIKQIIEFLFIGVFIMPYVIWKFIIKPKVKEEEFLSTFRFAVAITLVPLWLIWVFVVALLYFNMATATSIIIVCMVLALLEVKA